MEFMWDLFHYALPVIAGVASLVLGVKESLKLNAKTMIAPNLVSFSTGCLFIFCIFGQSNGNHYVFVLKLVCGSLVILSKSKFSKQFSLSCYVYDGPHQYELNVKSVVVFPLVLTVIIIVSGIFESFTGQSLMLPLSNVLTILLLILINPYGLLEVCHTIDSFVFVRQSSPVLGSKRQEHSYHFSIVLFFIHVLMLLCPFIWPIYDIVVVVYAILQVKYCFIHHTIVCITLVSLMSLMDAVSTTQGIPPLSLITCHEMRYTADCKTQFRLEYFFVPALFVSCLCHYEKYQVPHQLKIITSEMGRKRIGIPENEKELIHERQKIILFGASIGYILSALATLHFPSLPTLLTLTAGTGLPALTMVMSLYWPNGELSQFILTDSHQEIIDQLDRHSFEGRRIMLNQPSQLTVKKSAKENEEDIAVETKRSVLTTTTATAESSNQDLDHNLDTRFRFVMADLTSAIAHDPTVYEASMRLFSNSLIPEAVHKDVCTTRCVPLDHKARQIVNELYRQLQGHSEANKYLIEVCNALETIEDPRLNCVVAKISGTFSNNK